MSKKKAIPDFEFTVEPKMDYVSMSDLSRNATRYFNRMMNGAPGYRVMRNNRPVGVLLSTDQYETMATAYSSAIAETATNTATSEEETSDGEDEKDSD